MAQQLFERLGLEAIVLSTGPSLEVDRQRAEASAELYHEKGSEDFVIVSGVYNQGRFNGSQSARIYEILVGNGVVEDDVLFENESRNTIQKLTYLSQMSRPLGIQKLLLVSDELHAKRFAMLFNRAQKKGIIPDYMELETHSEGLDPSFGRFKASLAYLKDLVLPLKK